MDFIDKVIQQRYGDVTYGDVEWIIASDPDATGDLWATVDYEKNSSVVAFRVHTLVIQNSDATEVVITNPMTKSDLIQINAPVKSDVLLAFPFPYIFHGDKMSLQMKNGDVHSCSFSVGYQTLSLNSKTK